MLLRATFNNARALHLRSHCRPFSTTPLRISANPFQARHAAAAPSTRAARKHNPFSQPAAVRQPPVHAVRLSANPSSGIFASAQHTNDAPRSSIETAQHNNATQTVKIHTSARTSAQCSAHVSAAHNTQPHDAIRAQRVHSQRVHTVECDGWTDRLQLCSGTGSTLAMHQCGSIANRSNTALQAGRAVCALFAAGWVRRKRGIHTCSVRCKAATKDARTAIRRITRDDVIVQFVRSSGAGGQNVNKVATKVDMRFNLRKADWLEDDVKAAVEEMEKNRMNKAGELVISSQKTRSQLDNLEDALQKLQEILDAAWVSVQPIEEDPEKKKKLEKQKKAAKEARLKEKKLKAEKKGNRRAKLEY